MGNCVSTDNKISATMETVINVTGDQRTGSTAQRTKMYQSGAISLQHTFPVYCSY